MEKHLFRTEVTGDIPNESLTIYIDDTVKFTGISYQEFVLLKNLFDKTMKDWQAARMEFLSNCTFNFDAFKDAE